MAIAAKLPIRFAELSENTEDFALLGKATPAPEVPVMAAATTMEIQMVTWSVGAQSLVELSVSTMALAWDLQCPLQRTVAV